ncbi:MAG TPA: tail fiber domain-containing protein [Candidatus Elarobacter sp.]|nr:tail fiber domain-containing protein [Candidatus Elarobacter sp.]
MNGTITSSAPFSFIGDGQYNAIAGGANGTSFIGDGLENSILGADLAAIVGGADNTIYGEGAFIGGGGFNTAPGEGAVIGGGYQNTTPGAFSTIQGGYVNTAAGTYSFAAGARASAGYPGDFVWSDGSNGDAILTASRTYQFLARASGGFTLYTNPAATVGAQLAAGSGTWASLSDRNAKTAIVPLDDDAVLAKVDALPISRWSYKTERGVRHAGPMAQDFYAAFKLGEDDRHITSIDEDGVALAAIKALHADNRALHAQNAHLADANQRIERELAELRAEVASLRAR